MLDLADLEDRVILIQAGVNAVDAIHCAITEGSSMGSAWADGLWFVTRWLDSCCQELNETIKEELQRRAAERGTAAQ